MVTVRPDLTSLSTKQILRPFLHRGGGRGRGRETKNQKRQREEGGRGRNSLLRMKWLKWFLERAGLCGWLTASAGRQS